MNVRSRRFSPWLLLMLALQFAGAAIAVANQEWAILAVLLATLLLAPALRKPLDELDEMADALRTSDDELSHRALHDPLTGMANRALLFDRIGHALERRDHAPIAVLFIDLDDFKTFNDTLGHSRGDEVLLEVSRRLRSVLRPSDTVARLGGDEFVVLCEHAGMEEAEVIAQRMLAAIREPPDERAPWKLSASIGIATVDAASSASQVLTQADSAMYRAKEAGRNRVAGL
jgi:diguanylate cyclase (GGDEF)-like protein